MNKCQTPEPSSGFTLIEMLMVMILLALLGAFAVPRFMDRRLSVDENGFYHELKTAMRYAHLLAMSGGCEVEVVVNAATDQFSLYYPDNGDGVTVTCDGASAGFGSVLVTKGSGDSYQGTAPSGVDITSSLTYFYGVDGRPYSAVNTPWTTIQTVTLGNKTISIEPETGYVH